MEDFKKKRLLFLTLPIFPPSKKQLSASDPALRYPWNRAYELLGIYFCSSNNLNIHHSSIIFFPFNEKLVAILLYGRRLRYFSPSLRSIGSLIAKAFLKAQTIDPNIWVQSTPGIYCRLQNQEEFSDGISSIAKWIAILNDFSVVQDFSQDELLFYNLKNSAQNLYYNLLRRIYVP